MIFPKTILLLGVVTQALGLSLDTLPHRQKPPAMARFSPANHGSHDHPISDTGSNFVHQIHSKKKMPVIPAISHNPPKTDLYSHDDHKRIMYESGYPPLHSFHDHTKIKRKAEDDVVVKSKEEVGREELTNILKDEDSSPNVLRRERKIPPDTKRQEAMKKRKRESEETPEPLPEPLKEVKPKEHEEEHNDFQEWLRREYYRNMAKSFASMRKKRAMWGPMESESRDEDEEEEEEEHRRRLMNKIKAEKYAPTPKKEDRFAEVTENLKAIEDTLLADALHVVKDEGESYVSDEHRRQRVSNDLNAAYDIETMRSALFRLRDILYNMEDEANAEKELEIYPKHKKRGNQCAPLNVLTSDCAILGDIVPDDSLKDLLTHACNWHEVCYSCGEVFGLSSDNCDMGFVEQSRTICRGDVPCESTARLLLLPLRQRRVFYKRSNPSVCLVDPCVEEFLTRG